jgi:hypothetical protein
MRSISKAWSLVAYQWRPSRDAAATTAGMTRRPVMINGVSHAGRGRRATSLVGASTVAVTSTV